jgi:hypothetical protein
MKIFRDIGNFNASDPYASIELEQIQPLSERARSLMLRNRTKPLLREGFLNIVGAIEMLAGLEYHRDNIVRLSDDLAVGAVFDETWLYHEAVAYVNRLGQFHYFAMSSLVAKAVANAAATIPTIEKLLPFRMKHAAHRSIDVPRGESEDAQILQAMSFTRSTSRMMTLKPGATDLWFPPDGVADAAVMAEFRQRQWRNNYLTFQLYDEGHNVLLNLVVQREHPQICSEAFGLLAAVILWE